MSGGVKGVPEELLAQLHPLEVKVLPFLKADMLLSDLAKKASMQEVEATRALQWLENKGAVEVTPIADQEFSLGKNGEKALERGMPEHLLLVAVQEKSLTSEEAAKKAGLDPQEIGAAVGILKKQELVSIGEDKKISITGKGKSEVKKKHPAIDILKDIKEKKIITTAEHQEILNSLKSRKEYVIVKEKKDKRIKITDLGVLLTKVNPEHLNFESNLTREDLESGAWEKKKYRAFDVSVNVPFLPGGRAHFVQEAIDYVRRIWIEMGFEEMEGEMVQSAFWDLDALFVPQDHPAREVQDTFYLSNPANTIIDRDAFDRVRAVHENGGNTGSLGWRYKFSRLESQKLLLRTHTTAISARTLWAIRQGKGKIPGKHFIVSRVFRNEKLDWKHLFEFHQVEGIVVDKNVTFAHLVGYLKIFFAKMGYPQIRLRPHHFPYTEPSVEVDVWHPKKKQWIELGGAGMIRPEVTKTLIGEEIPVLAWGLGLERVIVDQFKFTDLRDLYRNDIAQLRTTRHFIGPEEER